jgi:hypothetical protein
MIVDKNSKYNQKVNKNTILLMIIIDNQLKKVK